MSKNLSCIVIAMICAAFFVGGSSTSVHAQNADFSKERGAGGGVSRVKTLSTEAGFEPVYRPSLFSNAIQIDADEVLPKQPHFIEIEYQKIPEPTGIDGRITHLLSGISLDIEPIYDHYGYEIRRFMARAGDVAIYKDREFLLEQIKNVRSAKIIAEYWVKDMDEQMKYLDEYFDKNASFSYVQAANYRDAKQRAQHFQVVVNGWINANEKFLTVLLENEGSYIFEYPYIRVSNNAKVQIYNALELRQARLIDLHNFPLFIMMVN